MTNEPSRRTMLSRRGVTFGPWCLALLLACLGSASTAQEQRPDPLMQLGRFVGTWSGTSMGQPGEGAVSRTYAKVMQGRYVQETNVSRYPPKEAGKLGEVHEHLSMFSYDKARKAIVLRQFHIESFVNTFRQTSAPGEFPMVFESESFENFSNSWKARETYEFVSDDEFVETFELAPPGKPFQVYSVNRLKRAMK